MKKHLVISSGDGGLGVLCGQHLFLQEGDAFGNHIAFLWKKVTCKRCKIIRQAILKGRKPPYGLSREDVLIRKHHYR